MDIYPKKLKKSELKAIEEEFEHDLNTNQSDESGFGGRDVRKLLCHILFLEKQIELLTAFEKYEA